MNEKELIELCDPHNIKKRKAKVVYLHSEIYGVGKHLRKYGFYPEFLPLFVNSDHGYTSSPIPGRTELTINAPYFLTYSKTKAQNWKRFSDKPCYVMFSPFVFYRRQNNIEKNKNAKGTIVFASHTTKGIDDISDIDKYIEQLKGLPEKYQPVSVCIHSNDIQKGLHKKFIDQGFEVFTAGHPADERFTQRFYEIIKNFSYATSNSIGTHLFYCVEMGIPFFLYGEKQKLINKADINFTLGEYDPYKEFEEYRQAYALFDDVKNYITLEQKSFVEEALGLKNGIGRMQMALVLYSALIKKIPFILKYLLTKGKINRKNFIDSMHEEIFKKENYKFLAKSDKPLIIDCGANIGFSIDYFKKLYPEAKIIGFEADPEIFKILEKNIAKQEYADVQIYNKAVYSEQTLLKFKPDGGWGGKIHTEEAEGLINVETIRLREYLGQRVDFLKIDIEGAETQVLKDCADMLHNVDYLFVEYHSKCNEEQTLHEILSILKNLGFRYHIKEASVRNYPFIERVKSGFDMQLDIYCYR